MKSWLMAIVLLVLSTPAFATDVPSRSDSAAATVHQVAVNDSTLLQTLVPMVYAQTAVWRRQLKERYLGDRPSELLKALRRSAKGLAEFRFGADQLRPGDQIRFLIMEDDAEFEVLVSYPTMFISFTWLNEPK